MEKTGSEGWRPKRQPRKTIGEEGSRKQTVAVFLLLLGLGLALYLPAKLSLPKWSVKLPSGGGGEVITIRRTGRPAESPRVRPNLETLIAGQAGEYGIFVVSVDGRQEFKLGENTVMTAASVIKLPILVVYYLAVDGGRLNPEDIYTVSEADRWEYGTGSLQHQPAGKKYTYKEVARLAANQSDNMGAEVLIKKLGGYSAVQKEIDKLKLSQTNLNENETTTADISRLFLALAQGKLLSQQSREELFTNLTNTVNEDRIPAGVPDSVRVVHKFGSEVGVVNDCGIVEAASPYVICVLTTGVNAGEAEPLLPQISQAVWNWLGD